MTEQPSYYAIIPADVRYDKNLSANEKLMFGEITCLTQSTGECWAGNKYFADLYGRRKDTISLWVRHLSEQGYISTRLVYKEGTKVVDRRIITLPDRIKPPSRDFSDHPPAINPKGNSTSINNTRDNKDNVAGAPEEALESETEQQQSQALSSSTKESVASAEAFERCWVMYKRKGSKAKALRYWNRLSLDDKQSVEKAIPAYHASNDLVYLKNFEGWINPINRMWEDLVIDKNAPQQTLSKDVLPDFV